MPKWNAPKSEEEIDNPAGWSMVTFQPRYDTKKSYLGHFTPTGAQGAPANPNRERVVDGWKFHYNGWSPTAVEMETYARKGADGMNLKPLT